MTNITPQQKEKLHSPETLPATSKVGDERNFARYVSEHLHRNISLADLKTTAVVAGAVAISVAVFQTQANTTIGKWIAGLSILFFGLSLLASAIAIIPRTPSGTPGLVFWMDISAFTSADNYAKKVHEVDESEREAEISRQNWYVAGVLRDKYKALRLAVLFFFIGVTTILAAAIIDKI